MTEEEFNNELNANQLEEEEPTPQPTRPRQRESYQSIMNALLVSGYEHIHGTPEEQEKAKGKTPTPPDSPTTTKSTHPGFPFRKKTDLNDNLPKEAYERPYLAAKVHATNGDPRVIGTDGINQLLYDEAELTAQPMKEVDKDMENEVSSYPFGENAYLDPGYLQALGALED